jgi:hypothetical protein
MKLVRIDDLRRCLAGAFERLDLTPEDAGGLAGLLVTPNSVAIATTASQRSDS